MFGTYLYLFIMNANIALYLKLVINKSANFLTCLNCPLYCVGFIYMAISVLAVCKVTICAILIYRSNRIKKICNTDPSRFTERLNLDFMLNFACTVFNLSNVYPQ